MSELTSLKFQCFQQSTVPNNYILLLDIGYFNLKNGSPHNLLPVAYFFKSMLSNIPSYLL